MAIIHKQPSEVRGYSMEFSNLLASGDSLTAVTSVLSTPSGPTIGSSSISGTQVLFSLSGGTTGTTYLIEVIVTTTDGETLEGDGTLVVDDIAATEAEVQSILQDDFTSGDSIIPYLTTAKNIVALVDAKDTGNALSDALLLDITRWLAAHLYTVQNHQLMEEKTGDVAGVYAGTYGMGLDSSKYGQTAKMMDITGYLRKISKGSVKAGLSWLGKVPSDQTDYVDRD